VPVAPWSGGAVDTVEDALSSGRRIGYPLVVKATAGGGGRGIRVVAAESELANAFESARGEALRSFGDETVFLERLVEDARHVEVQVVADHHGSVWALGVRDCSAQRRRQKVIEESSSTALSPEAAAELKAAAARMCQAAGYRNAGTVEFLYHPADGTTTFLEVNTRLQVEHPVTELTTGVDIVKLQLAVAEGYRLDGSPPAEFGHAMEARLNAEDPQRGFSPAPGAIEHLVLPTGPGVRVDTGVSAGDVIPPQYDSMIAKIIAWGRDRDEARARLSRAIAETVVVVRGGTTNKSFLLELLERPELARGEVTTGWLDRVAGGGELAPPRYADVALLTAAVHVVDEREALEQASFFAAAARGRPAPRPHHRTNNQ
jgi:acetyl/propionyl-CoA carboxylase alpha subunit